MSISTRHDQIRAELEATRKAFHAFAATITEEDWDKPSENPAWTVGELLYHITVALQLAPEDIFFIRKVGWMPRLPESLFHHFNEWNTRRGADRASPANITAVYDQAHARLLNLLDTLSDADLDKGLVYPGWDPLLEGSVTIERLYHYVSEHFEVHRAEINRSLNRNDESVSQP